MYIYIYGMSSSQLTFKFFRGVAQPPTSTGWLFSGILYWTMN